MSRLNIQANGIIKGGFVEYSVDGATVKFNGEVQAKIGFWTKSFPLDGSFAAPSADQLQRGAFVVPGTVLVAGPATATILDVDTESRQAHVKLEGPSGNGLATIDVSYPLDQPIEVLAVHLDGSVHGIHAVIEAVKA